MALGEAEADVVVAALDHDAGGLAPVGEPGVEAAGGGVVLGGVGDVLGHGRVLAHSETSSMSDTDPNAPATTRTTCKRTSSVLIMKKNKYWKYVRGLGL